MKHKHAEIIKAWADGAEIEVKWKNAECDWYPQEDFLWFIRSEFADKADFRIKPKRKPDLYKYVDVRAVRDGICQWTTCLHEEANLGLIFDGETGKLKSAEVLK
jgi:hypothetical protein